MRRFLTDPSRAGVWVLICILAVVALVVMLFVDDTKAETPVDMDGQQTGAQARVERAMSWIVFESRWRSLANPVARRPDWRRELAGLIAGSAETNEIPPLLWTAIVFRESSFRIGAKGALGEVGLSQVHGTAAEGCELDTARGQLECGARWLGKWIDKCGTLEGGFSKYASGRVCRADTPHLRDVVHDRWKLWAKLERLSQ